jgi:hypothetical protein
MAEDEMGPLLNDQGAPSSPQPRTPVYTPTPAANEQFVGVVIPAANTSLTISSPVEVVDLTHLGTSPFGPVVLYNAPTDNGEGPSTVAPNSSDNSTATTGQALNGLRRSTRQVSHRRPNLSGELPQPKRTRAKRGGLSEGSFRGGAGRERLACRGAGRGRGGRGNAARQV